jgi:hypothetical protein
MIGSSRCNRAGRPAEYGPQFPEGKPDASSGEYRPYHPAPKLAADRDILSLKINVGCSRPFRKYAHNVVLVLGPFQMAYDERSDHEKPADDEQ